MELAAINNLVIRTEMPVGDGPDEVLRLSYRIGALNPEFWTWFYDPANQNASIYEVLERILVATGITVDGEPVPPTAAALQAAGLPAQVARAMFEHIRQEGRAGKLSAAS